MNLVALIGNVASHPELGETITGKAICTFQIAVPRLDAQLADYFTVVTHERQAEICDAYLSVSLRIGLEGRLFAGLREGRDGSPESKVSIRAHRVQLLGNPSTQPDEDE